MNYYEHHLGDYAEATAHLTFIEDAAYSRCIRKYYSSEQPLPPDVKQVQRLVGARTKEEKDAVESVLQEFFRLEEDGWHNDRCDEELARYREGDGDRQLKAENERERKRRSRERRRLIFDELRKHGVVPKWDTPTASLEDQLSRVTGRDSHAAVTDLSRGPVTHRSRTGDATGTATQSPVPTSQTPDTTTKNPPDVSSANSEVVADSQSLAAPTTGKRRKGAEGRALKRMPKDFDTDQFRPWARQNTPGVNFDREIAKLRDHKFRDGHTDWGAVVRNWLRKAEEFQRPNGNAAARHNGANGSSLLTHEEREAAELQKLKDRRHGIGLADFRDPLPNEPADAYRKAQDDEWTRRREKRPSIAGRVVTQALKGMPS